jgi:hypothetical protein
VVKVSSAGSEEKQPPYSMIFLLIIGLFAAFFLVRGFDAYINGDIGSSISYLLFGFFGVFFVAFMASRFSRRLSAIPSRVTFTLLQCSSCAFKSIRNFQVGDYIPKPMGVCPSCGGPFIVEAIYSEEKGPTKKKKESV